LKEEKTQIEYNHLSYINHISLFNSASYAFFEENFNQHLLLTGNNNVGKTTILNALQFVLLPETNLKNFKNKFTISSDGKKTYTSEETFKYYFPSENSYIIVEINNGIKTFCLIVHRGKISNNYDFQRILVELPFKEIKKRLISKDRENNTELSSISKEDLIKNLKEQTKKESKVYKEIKAKKDIIEWFLNTRKDNRKNDFCVIPLKDTTNETIKGFSTLFKSLYNITSMTKEDKIKFISDIVETRQLDNSKIADFDLKDYIEKIKEFKKTREKIDILSNNQNIYEEIMQLSEDIKDNYSILKNLALNIYKSTNDNILVIDKTVEKFKETKIELVKEKEELELSKEEIQKKITEQKEDAAIITSKLLESKNNIKTLSNYIYKYLEDKFEVYSSKPLENLIKEVKEENDFYIQMKKIFTNELNIKKEDLETILKEINNYKDLDVLKKQKEDIQYKINLKQKEVKELEEKISSLSFVEEECFSKEEKTILNSVFNSYFINNSVEKLSKEEIEELKRFIKLFEIKNNLISFGELKINVETVNNTNTKDLLRNTKESLEIELEELVKQRDSIQKSEEKDVELILLELNNQKETKEEELEELEEYLHTIKNLIPINQKIEELEEQKNSLIESIKIKERKKSDISSDIERNISELQDYNKEFSTTLFEKEKLEKVKEKLELYDNFEFYFNTPINNLKIEREITIGTEDKELERYLHSLNEFNKMISRSNQIMSKYVNYKLFDNEFSIEVLNLYQNDDEEGKEAFEKMLSYLRTLYESLEQEKNHLDINIHDLNIEINNDVQKLTELTRGIERFSKEINKEFENIQISDLGGVRFKISINSKLSKILKNIDNNFDTEGLSNEKSLIDLQNYIGDISNDSNRITTKDLISDIDYVILNYIGDGVLREVKESQSNGTETLINLIFITILFRGIFKSGYFMKLLIPLDESSKVDNKNGETLLNTMGKNNCKIVGAAPIATPEQLTLYNKTLMLDKKTVQKSLSPKAIYLVDIEENEFNIFTNESIE